MWRVPRPRNYLVIYVGLKLACTEGQRPDRLGTTPDVDNTVRNPGSGEHPAQKHTCAVRQQTDENKSKENSELHC